MSGFRRIPLLFLLVVTLFLACPPLLAQTVIDTVLVGSGPSAVAVNPATNMIYVVNYFDQTVSVMNAANDTVVATVPVGNDPYGLVVNPFTNRIYVVNEDNTVTFIDGNTNTPQTIQVGNYPQSIDINTVTNLIYVTNYSDGTVSVIDGSTSLIRATVPVRNGPVSLAINPATNRIYVCNWSENTISVIDGASNTDIDTVLVGNTPNFIVVNPVTNKIYVTTYTDHTLVVINGNTDHVLATLPLSDTPDDMTINPMTGLVYVFTGDGYATIVNGNNQIAGTLPLTYDAQTCGYTPGQTCSLVDPVTNKIYIPSEGDNNGQLEMIDGNNNNVNTTVVGDEPSSIGINLGTNRLYVANYNDNTISVVTGANASPMEWYSVTPCRLVDTRHSSAIPGGTSQTFFVPQLGNCGIPATAVAFSLNVTVVPRGELGYLTIWPTGEAQPFVSTMNSYDGRIKANAAIVPAGYSGGVDVYVTNTTDVILDIDGYFAPPSLGSSQFYPLTPCRVVDTRRTPNGPLGGPYMPANQTRNFPVLQSPCFNGVSNPQAYSFNVGVVPHTAGQPLGYLTIWPGDQTQQPVVSTLNNPTGTAVANAAIVPAAQSDGSVNVYVYNDTDVFIDVDGYFGTPSDTGLSMYPAAPCRVLDTRASRHGQPFSGTLSPPINVQGSTCAPDPSAQAYIFNATVVPYGGGPMGYLTLWPDGSQGGQPGVSTLNAYDGWVTSNMAIVPNINGSIDAYADGSTHLIMDISGYFAPTPTDNQETSKPTPHPRRTHHRQPQGWRAPK